MEVASADLASVEVAMPPAIVVLIVEDEELIRLELAEDLSERGFTVLEAANARSALEILGTHPEVQVLFTDVGMPGGMNGLRLAAAVAERWSPIKIIITSGHKSVDLADVPDGSLFFGKPVRPAAIAEAMLTLVHPRL